MITSDHKCSPNKGLTICYYGDGKGKTTAALGLALRAMGRSWKTLIIQFIKGDWESGEEIACRKNTSIFIRKMGKGFVGLGNNVGLEEHIKSAQIALRTVEQAFLDKYDVVVADEILGAIKGRLITKDDVISLIKLKPSPVTLVLTGQPKIEQIIKKCDLVTEMKKIKHPYDKGRLAIKGIDY